jgi:hypothetical protein
MEIREMQFNYHAPNDSHHHENAVFRPGVLHIAAQPWYAVDFTKLCPFSVQTLYK